MGSSSRRRLWIPVLVLCGLLSVAGWCAAAGPGALRLAGTVTDLQGEPIVGAMLRLRPYASGFQQARELVSEPAILDRPVVARAESGASGRFALEVPEAGMWQLQVTATGWVPVTVPLLPLLEARELPPIRLERGRTLELIVDSDTDLVPQARVSVEPGRSPALRAASAEDVGRQLLSLYDEQTQTTHSFGNRIEIVAPQSGEMRVLATAPPEYLPLVAEIGGGASQRLVLHSGRRWWVLDVFEPGDRSAADGVAAGAPAGGALVQLRSGPPERNRTGAKETLSYLLTDADGRVAVPQSADGVRIVSAQHRAVLLEQPQAEEGEVRRVVLEPPLVVVGRVVEKGTQRAVAGAFVHLDDPGDCVRSDAQGRFRIERALDWEASERGRAPLVAVASGYLPRRTTLGRAQLFESAPVEVALEPASQLSGIVVNAQGEPVAEATVRAWTPDARTNASYAGVLLAGYTATSEDGRFTLPDLPKTGELELQVEKPGYTLESVAVPAFDAQAWTSMRVELLGERAAFGTVVDEQQRPLVGAQVTLTPSVQDVDYRTAWRSASQSADLGPRLQQSTDAEGRFAFDSPPAGLFDLAVFLEGYAPAEVPGVEIPRQQDDLEIGTVTLSPGATLEGRVLDLHQHPLSGATVEAVRPRGGYLVPRAAPRRRTVTTAEDGSFAIDSLAPDATLDLEVRRAGYVPAKLEGVRPSGEPVLVALERGARLSGRTVDVLDQPLSGATIQLEGAQLTQNPSRGGTVSPQAVDASAKSDAEGRFVFDALPSGLWTVHARLDGYVDTLQDGIALDVGKEAPALTLVLEKGGVLAGRVLDASGEPIERAIVATAQGAPVQRIAGTSSDGSFRLEGLPLGHVSIQATHRDYLTAVRDAEIAAGENRLELRLERGFEIEGTVSDGGTGKPIGGVAVRAQEHLGSQLWTDAQRLGAGQATSDALGHFLLTGLAAGGYYLTASREGFAPMHSARPIELHGEPVRGVVLNMDRGTTVRGRVVGLDFDALAHVAIVGVNDDQSYRHETSVDFDGAFHLEDAPPGALQLVARSTDQHYVQKVLTIEPGVEEIEVELDFATGLRLSGQLMRGAAPATGLRILVIGDSMRSGGETASDQTGRFSIDGLAEDTYRLIVTDPGRALPYVHHVRVDADRDLTIELRDSVLEGVARDGISGTPLEGVAIALRPEGDAGRYFNPAGGMPATQSDGTFRFTVPPGSYRLSASKPGYGAVARSIEARVEQPVELELELAPTGVVELRVLRADGSPAPMVSIAALDAAGQASLVRFLPTSEGGRVLLNELGTGEWTLLASEPGAFAVASEQVVVAEAGTPSLVELRLPPTGELRVDVADVDPTVPLTVMLLDPSGRPLQYPAADLVLSRLLLRPGNHVVAVPVGTWTVKVSADNREWTGKTTVVAGQVAEVHL